MKILTEIIFSIIIILVAIFAFHLLVTSKKDVGVKEKKAEPTFVKVIKVKKTNEDIFLYAYGAVQAKTEVVLHPEISGQIIKGYNNFTVGGVVKENEELVLIDPTDLKTAQDATKAEYQRAKLNYRLEKSKAVVAKDEWKQAQLSLQEKQEADKQLIFRTPHLHEKKASLFAAKSKLSKAAIDIKRTIIRSPLDAIITVKHSEIGKYITPITPLANLVATDKFEVQANISQYKLKWLQFPSKTQEGSKVWIIQDIGNKQKVYWEAKLKRLLGSLEPSSRMARILLEVEDPLCLKSNKPAPLLLGTFVKVKIQGSHFKDIYKIPRFALRNGNQIWVKNENDVLEIRRINILFKNDDNVFANQGVMEGDDIVISFIPIPIEGMRLKNIVIE